MLKGIYTDGCRYSEKLNAKTEVPHTLGTRQEQRRHNVSSDPSGGKEKKGRGFTRKDHTGQTMEQKTGRLLDGIQEDVGRHQTICSKG